MLNNAPLAFTEHPSYIGMTFDTQLSWSHHISCVAADARRKLNIISRLFSVKHSV